MPHMWRWTMSASFIVSLPMTGRRFEALSAMRDELRMPAAASAAKSLTGESLNCRNNRNSQNGPVGERHVPVAYTRIKCWSERSH